MLDTSRWLLDLCALGLTQYEAKVYLALMQRRFFTAAEVARVSTVPRQRIYDVLSSLFERGLVRIRQGGSMQYTAIDPQQAMDRLIAERRAALEGLERTTTELLAALAPKWSDGQAEADPLNFVELIRDPRTVGERLADLQRGAGRRLLLLARPPLGDATADRLATTARLHEAGGEVRCVYEPLAAGFAERGPEGFAEWATGVGERGPEGSGERAAGGGFAERLSAGERARVAASLPIGLCIVDDARALMSLRDPVAGRESATHVLVEHPELARFLTLALGAVGAQATPVQAEKPGPDALSRLGPLQQRRRSGRAHLVRTTAAGR